MSKRHVDRERRSESAAQRRVVARAADKAGGEVHRSGVNACKGQGACASAQNSCKGQIACKGKGFVNMSGADECTKAGGKVIEPKGAPKIERARAMATEERPIPVSHPS